jgi:hypothetical protein
MTQMEDQEANSSNIIKHMSAIVTEIKAFPVVPGAAYFYTTARLPFIGVDEDDVLQFFDAKETLLASINGKQLQILEKLLQTAKLEYANLLDSSAAPVCPSSIKVPHQFEYSHQVEHIVPRVLYMDSAGRAIAEGRIDKVTETELRIRNIPLHVNGTFLRNNKICVDVEDELLAKNDEGGTRKLVFSYIL